MKKNQSSFVGQELDFYHWLPTQPDNKLALDFYIILSTINAYGKKRRCFEESLFELRDSEHVKKFRNMVQDDKRFRFLNYGRIRQILLILEKYDQYLQEKEKAIVTKTPVSEQRTPVKTHTEDDQFFDDVSPAEPVLDELKPKDDYVFEEPTFVQSESGASVVDDMNPVKPASEESKKDAPVSETVTGNNGSIVIRTINGTEYRGNTPAEALAFFCEAMAREYPDKVKELIGMRVLTTEGTCQDRITLQNVQGFIDRNLKESAVMRYAKWLSDSCGESDSPKTIMVSALKPDEVQPVIKSESSVSSDASKPQESSMGTAQSEAAVSATRTWTKYEVALLIEAYLKTAENKGNFRTIAEDLSHTLRELAAKHGKAIDSTYRNVNGIVMQLGIVQYIFTNGQSGFSNSSAQIRDMVSVYKNWPAEYHQTLAETHRLVNEPSSEIYKLLPEEDFSLFRNELFRSKIQSVEQLRSLDLWAFINRYGLYAISSRHEICNRINARLNPPSDNPAVKQPEDVFAKQPESVSEIKQEATPVKQSDVTIEKSASPQRIPVERDTGTQFCLKTRKGLVYYGSCPAGALASFGEALAQKYPSKIRSLVGQRYNGIGQIVLYPDQSHGKGIPLLDPPAFIDKNLVPIIAQHYGAWLCRMCGELDIPVSVSASSAVSKPVTTPDILQHRSASTPVTAQKPVVSKPLTETKSKPVEVSKPVAKPSAGIKSKPAEVRMPPVEEKKPTAPDNQRRVVFEPVTIQQTPYARFREEKKKELQPKQSDKSGEGWLFKMLSVMDIQYDDRRDKKGCLWIWGGHELDQFIFLCEKQGYKFCFKPNTAKGPAWWTTDHGDYKPAVAAKKEQPKQETVSTAAFRHWLEQDFRSFLIRKKGLARGTVSQYCQSVEAIEQFFMRNHLAMTLNGVDAKKAEHISKQLANNPDFVDWNKHGHHQYSAALAQYIEFLRAAEPATSVDPSQKAESIREIVIRILSETNRPMTTSEIYKEIERRNLYSFNSNNPFLIVDHAIRKSCEGANTTPHCKVDDFGRIFDEKGVSHYYLLRNGKPETSKTTREIVWEKPVSESDSRWNEILTKYFPDGYILNDFLSQLQAKTYWQEAYGDECPLEGDSIDEALKSVGSVRDGRVFVRSEEENSLIDDICAEIKDILQEYTAVYIRCVFDRYQEKLAKYSIFTEKVMEQLLLEKSRHSFRRSGKAFVLPGHESYLTNDCRKVLRNHGGAMPVSEVQKILWFIPGDAVYHTLSVDKEAINIGNSVWLLAEHFPLTADDAEAVGDVLEEYFISNDYLQAADILPLLEDKLPAIAADLNGFHFSAIFGILKLYLDNRFSFTKAIVAPKGAKTEFKDLFRSFAIEHSHFSLDELSAFAKELKTPIYWETLSRSGAVRISQTEFVNQREINFDIPATDKVLEDICPGDYIPIMSVSPAMMMHLPVCGYQWNAYLLLNYVLSFSKIFRASYNSLGKTGAYGAIVRKDCKSIGDYNQLIERVLTDDDTWHTVDDVRTILVERGFQASRDLGGIDKIMARAKQNKLKDRG